MTTLTNKYRSSTTGNSLLRHAKSSSNNTVINCNYPLALMPLPTQIAGHGSEGDGQRAILKREDGKLLKPIQAPPKGPREAEFYRKISQSRDPIDIRLRNFIPKFHGIEQVGFTNGIIVTEDFLVLDDITENFIMPNVMDVKIGRKTFGPDATEKKMTQEMSKYVGTKVPFGFSILGMIVHSLEVNNDQVKIYDKSYGKNLKTENVSEVPKIFFNHGHNPPPELVQIVVQKMASIKEAFEAQRKYKIFASSLLMSYDAEAVAKFKIGKICEIDELKKHVNIRLIDFAHVFDANGERDENFLEGLGNLLELFKNYLKQLQKNNTNQ